MADGIFYPQVPTTALAFSTSQQFLSQSGLGGLKVSNIEPSRHKLAEAGRIYSWSSATATAKAPVTAIPTTAAIFALWNGNTAASTLQLSILGIGYFQVSGTAGLGAALIAGVTGTSQTAVTSATNAIKGSCSGSTRTSAATFGTDITLGATPSWAIWGGTNQPAAVQVGAGVYVPINGELLVPTGCCLGMSVLSPAGTNALYGMSVIYAEIECALV